MTGWTGVASPDGYGDDYHQTSTSTDVASWTFSGLEAGREYQVVATWPVDPGNTASVTLRMLDGTTVLSTQQLDQTDLDADLTIDGHPWL